MSTLVNAVHSKLNSKARTLFDAKKIEHLIHTHQNQYPGNWQSFEVEDKSLYIAEALNRAALDNETVSERIAMIYC